MKDKILIYIMAVIFILGYFQMKKLDVFLKNNCRQNFEDSEISVLLIAFEVPMVITSVSNLLEDFSRKNPNCELHLLYGSADEIVKKLAENKIDFGFITTAPFCNFEEESNLVSIQLKQNPLTFETVGFSVMPLDTEKIMTKIVWKEKGCSHAGKLLVEQLRLLSRKEQATI